ncbi:hypothetical protein Wildcat_61 [Mycobacterium phage Wildcat]|uniref:Uncharacterized protein n=3 Tax=Mycobacterium virus Wildcat TaxID=1993859 RepID=Q19XZ9_9CAUD|nr:hypothetical protein Wildcat_61 [Mycobacterium phage Wildcat]ABE67666.1 hypothetical protein Wildcat_61 [Mycobacterium phage Wildcat]QGJ90032.1 hypothetical protein PBI_MARYV_61 [Mycobacterium phage MaryV]QHB49795.1 hypothetical protein EniyanLRS_165 [Mycobacterium phage EniyanLRS]
MNPERRITEIIEAHQPDEHAGHLANERWCKGCPRNSFRVWPWSEFPAHQAEMIMNELGIHRVRHSFWSWGRRKTRHYWRLR